MQEVDNQAARRQYLLVLVIGLAVGFALGYQQASTPVAHQVTLSCPACPACSPPGETSSLTPGGAVTPGDALPQSTPLIRAPDDAAVQDAGSQPPEASDEAVEPPAPAAGDGAVGDGGSPDYTPHPTMMPTFKTREDIADILETLQFKRGAELGVQRGVFSASVLSRWKSAEEYHLVDLWAHQKNYDDGANVDDNAQNVILQQAIANTKRWQEKITLCRNFTIACVHNYPDGYFDFVYVDARHDRKGVLQDLEMWWPKVRAGGIMAGHDYVVQREVAGQDWTLNYDGTRDETGRVVKGAVDDFFMTKDAEAHGRLRQLAVVYKEKKHMPPSWAVRK